MSVIYLESPTKSENDKKKYKILKLSNNITAILVSDPSEIPKDEFSEEEEDDDEDDNEEDESSTCSEEDVSIESTSTEDETDDSSDEEEGDDKLAACALMVDVGSYSDPRNIQGLAHLLEHMIFMGSEKFPEENAFDSHIKKCGGFDNADTDFEETKFYFEVPNEDLDSSMERFVALFEAPLMKIEAINRERQSVESEFQSTLQDDEQRRDQLIGSEIGQESHPCSLFPWGNLKTLKDNIDDQFLYNKLHEFRRKHYSAHRMYLAVQARLPLCDIEELVVKHFSKIPSNNLPGDDFKKFGYQNAFKENFYKNVYFVKPVSNTCKLELTWLLPSLTDEYKCKPHHYLAYILGYEGPGSLCAYLRNKLYSLEMVAGTDDSGFEFNSMYTLFTLCIYLTESGFNHIDEVLSTTFSYIQLIKEKGPDKTLYQEIQSIENATFRYQNETSAFDNVQDLVVQLKYYPPKDVLTGPEIYFDYNSDSISKLINMLSDDMNFNIMITSPYKYNNIKYDKIEKWFGTEYTTIPVPQKWKELWENAKSISELRFPDRNVFITTDFRIWCKEDDFQQNPQYPKKIMDSDLVELYFKQDDKYLLPEGYIYIYFKSPLQTMNIKNAVLMSVYAQLIKFQLGEKLYPASVAGLNYQYYSSEKGLVLKVNGYNEKLHLIVDIITKCMKNITDEITEDQLNAFIKQQQKNYYNSLIKPKSLNKDIRLGIIESSHWLICNKYNVVKQIVLEDLKSFSYELLKEIKIQALIQGNLKEETAHNIMNKIITNLGCSVIQNKNLMEFRACELPTAANHVICQSLNANDVNTSVCNYYQVGPCTLKKECILDLLLLFVEEPLFDILRTKQQLAYDVSCSARNNCGILGYTITVNSQENKFSSTHVDERIEAFRLEFLQILKNMDVVEFERTKQSLIKLKQVADNELKEEVIRNWGEMISEEYIFDRLKREIDCIKLLTKNDLVAFCVDMEQNNLRKLSIQVVGNSKKTSTLENPKNKIQNTLEGNNPEGGNDDSELKVNTELDNESNINKFKNGIHLKFLKTEKSTINDIQIFKKGLLLYPVTKTLLDSPSPVQDKPEIIM